MKITLKRVILCGGMLLAAIFFLLVLVVPVNAWWGPQITEGNWTLSTKESWLAAGSNKAFYDSFLYGFTMTISSTTKEAPKVLADAAQGTLRVMSIIGLVFVILDLLAITGAFFLKSQKGARGLIIPFMAVSIVVMFLVIIIPGALLCQSVTVGDKAYLVTNCDLGTLEILLFVAIGLFIGSLIAAGVVKDKVLVGKKN